MENNVDSVTRAISSYLFTFSVVLMLVNTLFVQSNAIVNSLLTWIELSYEELQTGTQSSSKCAWLLVYSYVHYCFKELRKVRAPVQVASNMSSKLDRVGAKL